MKQKFKKRLCFSKFAVFAFILCSFSFSDVLAQRTITGAVTDANGVPLPSVNVLQKGTKNGVAADFDGNYAIKLIPGQEILVFSYIGFKSKEVAINAQDVINVSLEEDAENLDEVVIIGYAAVQREKVLGAVGTVKSENITQAAPTSAFDGIQGRLSGVQIQTNGGPGAGFDVRVRGTSTFGGGDNSPLYVVDGQQLDNIDNIDPNDIASLEVLKDGATAAIYGSRGANGVVLITTKSGRAGDLDVQVNALTGITSLIGSIPVANTRERILYEDLRRGPNDALTGNQRDSLNLLLRNSFDLQDLITRASVRNQVNVAVSGGGEKARAYWNVGFLDEQGVVINSDFKRINSRFKIDFTPNDKLKIGTNLNVSFEEQNGLNENQVFQQLVERIAYFPVFEPNGSFTPEIAGRQNPVAEAELRTIRTRSYRAQNFNYIQYEFIPNLTIRSTLGINLRYRRFNEFNPILVNNPRNQVATGAYRDRLEYDVQQENFFNYDNVWGKHTFGAFAGMQTQKFWFEGLRLSTNFVTELIPTFNNVDPETLAVTTGTNNTEDRTSALFSLFGGFSYDFDNRYLIGATIRRDGSSRFGIDTRYGVFPSATVGWNISNESFLSDSQTVNNLLIRASYGVTGNDDIGDYDFTSTYVPGATYNGVSGIAPSRLGNSSIKWEETESLNLGLDLGMFKNRLRLNLDFWTKTTTDLLANVPLPEESGFASVRRNVGSLENRGIDISLGGTILKTADFSWNSSFNISFQENEVTELFENTPFESGQYFIEEGQPIGNIYGFKNLGIFPYNESNAFTPEGVQLTPNFDAAGTFVNYTLNGSEYTGDVNQLRNAGRTLEGGDIYWDDIDNDFDITVDDRQILGNGLPTTFGGFSNDFTYKDLSLSFLLEYSFGNDIYRRYDEQRNDLNSSNETPGSDRILNAWLNPGDITVYPRLNRVPQNRERPNSFFVTDGSYIKLRFVRFNYNLPKRIIDKVGWAKRLSFNMSLNNFLTWTNYPGYNPELGSRGNPLQPGLDQLRYPNEREVILGVNLQF
ncbi:SusC/RagA family TonB-linked outer membrane protein [Spongiivirga citrea]|uniref:SusC/RagA family TonB-linked outer membrane protein n=1 Tax=Spongiivirga citrea TaxID=1481457 RepID=A0A6M0CJ20_9FLAO|nr:TonB-dependent receptor [Spongiivirga citrea]NER17831.1 SusC/RagA family TonB-linked outer membrane protein [Spongiivirga citrea]